jgi:hypothetical protein
MKIIGILSILIGFALTLFTTISVFTNQRVVGAGGVEVTEGHWYQYSWSPLLGIGLIIIGGILVLSARKATRITVTEQYTETEPQ